MKMTWQSVKLGDICGFKYGEMPRPSDLTATGYTVFSGYREVGYSSRYHYRDPEVIVVARGVGGTGDIKMTPPFCFLTNLAIAILVQSAAIIKPFLYYRLASTSLWELRTGSAQAQITIERLKSYEVLVPPLPVQRRIVAILSAYDDLIENSQRRIKILESMARALYREWFVHFRFPGHEGHPRVASDRLHRAVKPDVAALEFAARTATLRLLADAIRENLDRPDLSRVLGRIEALLDESIVGITIRDSGAPPLDLSAVNLEDLVARFLESARQNPILEILTAAVRDRLERMIETNPSRADYAARFEEMIERYNAGSRGREEHFRDLVRFARQLDEEQKRHLRENLSEEELAVFDILTRPGPELSAKERGEVRKVVQELLPRMKELLVLNWRQKQTARARIQEAIRSKLDELPESYTTDVYDQKCSAVFRHVYEKYPERDAGIYAQAG